MKWVANGPELETSFVVAPQAVVSACLITTTMFLLHIFIQIAVGKFIT